MNPSERPLILQLQQSKALGAWQRLPGTSTTTPNSFNTLTLLKRRLVSRHCTQHYSQPRHRNTTNAYLIHCTRTREHAPGFSLNTRFIHEHAVGRGGKERGVRGQRQWLPSQQVMGKCVCAFVCAGASARGHKGRRGRARQAMQARRSARASSPLMLCPAPRRHHQTSSGGAGPERWAPPGSAETRAAKRERPGLRLRAAPPSPLGPQLRAQCSCSCRASCSRRAHTRW